MEIPRHWRLKKQRYNLTGEICPHCDTKLFPPRDICTECGHNIPDEKDSLPTQGRAVSNFTPEKVQAAEVMTQV